MNVFQGIGVSKGIAVGIVLCNRHRLPEITPFIVDDKEREWNRFLEACAKSKNQLKSEYENHLKIIGGDAGQIFETHELMIEDKTLCDSVEGFIKNKGYNAEYALNESISAIIKTFSKIDDEYLRERAADVDDIGKRILYNLLGIEKNRFAKIDRKVILMSRNFLPSETVMIDKKYIKGFIAQSGGATSHAAIIARTVGVPAVVGIDAAFDEIDGKNIIIDGDSGIIILEPDEKTLNYYDKLKEEKRKKQSELLQYASITTKTKDGKRIPVYSNIGNISDMKQALDFGCEGIGLLRSEFLFTDKSDPDENEQFERYKEIIEIAEGKPVVIRTFDVSADKIIKSACFEGEPNPALGLRGIRFCLKFPEFLKKQLKALIRASVFGDVSILFPMLTTELELDSALAIISEIKDEFRAAAIRFSDSIKIGVMIETPSAALISDVLAQKVDFFSIGTNDLTQYILAADRANADVSYIYDAAEQAVLRIIKLVIENAHKSGIRAGICGESASDYELTENYIDMGADYFSVAPTNVLTLRKHIISVDSKNIKNKNKRLYN